VGRFRGDPQPKLFAVYPKGNWIEADPDSPYFIVGRTHYEKPILDLLLTSRTSLRHATSLAFFAFEMTQSSVHDADFPIDFLVSDKDRRERRQHRYLRSDLEKVSSRWNDTLCQALKHFPSKNFAKLFLDR